MKLILADIPVFTVQLLIFNLRKYSPICKNSQAILGLSNAFMDIASVNKSGNFDCFIFARRDMKNRSIIESVYCNGVYFSCDYCTFYQLSVGAYMYF